MLTLVAFNSALILVIVAILILIKKTIRTEAAERALFIVAPIVTIVLHYSTLIYLCMTGADAYAYLRSNPNLILPIYPCNAVMWCALIYGLMRNKDGRFSLFLSDYVFWFGIASTLVGMFANVDFITNPDLRNYEVVKSILAHATLLFNLLLIPVLGRLKPSFFRNMFSIAASSAGMYLIGLYCNLVYEVVGSAEMAYNVNSMFIIHSPFESLQFLRYPIIAAVSLVIYFVIFTVCDLINTPRGERWFDRIRKRVATRVKK